MTNQMNSSNKMMTNRGTLPIDILTIDLATLVTIDIFDIVLLFYITLSILGRNPALENVREIPIVGGSGIFRCARSSIVFTTYMYNADFGAAIVEYNVSILHV
ncbi:Dirigent protein 19 [Glycine soja]|uniref:Dirigent protein n=1 Tax=Glycine soja TaxID=3848 RepID=A0A445I3F0_GLYSO|nr:Dirigent protein 19 [Glycine soja]